MVFGLPHSVSSALALPLLRAVRQALPQVQLELTEELTGNLTPQLRAGQIQLAVLFDDGTLSEFSWTPMLRERLCLIGPPQGTARRPASVTLRRALAQPLILPAQPHGVRPLIEAAARDAGLAPPQAVTDISSISILRTSLLAGLGQTLLPVMPLKADVDAGLLQATPVVSPPLERVLALCTSAHIPLSAAAQAVAQQAMAVAGSCAAAGNGPARGWWRRRRPTGDPAMCARRRPPCKRRPPEGNPLQAATGRRLAKPASTAASASKDQMPGSDTSLGTARSTM